MKELLLKNKIHLYILGIIFLISAAYVPEAFEGKQLQQSDITQYKGAAAELTDYRNNKDEIILWTNSQFCGMPTYLISGLASHIALKHLRFPKKPYTWEKIFLYLFCGYIMFLSFGARPWVALIGAIGLGLATENLIIITVGHNTKALAIAYLPLIIAGANYLFKKKYLLGLNLFAIGLGLQILVNHLQITYYTGILVGLFFVFKFIKAIQEKTFKDYAVAFALSILGLCLAVGANALPLLLTNEYSKHTIRSKTELTLVKENGEIKTPEKISTGLTSDYAFAYSTGWTDMIATFIPNYSGGDSDRLGLYYGDIGSTSGPKYMGAVFFLLAVIGFVFYKGIEKWWLLAGILLTMVLSMGGNHFVGFNQWVFDTVPLYNKFRAPSMMMVLMQVCIGILAVLGIEAILNADRKDPEVLNKLKYAGIGVGAFLVLVVFFSGIFNDFNSNPKYDSNTGQVVYDSDTRYAQMIIQRNSQQPTQQAIDRIKESMAEQRIEEMKKDGYRTFFFVIAAFFVLWFAYKQKLETKWALLILGLLVTLDMWTVGKRYLSGDDFKSKAAVQNAVMPNNADLAIEQDTSYYRVLDLTVNPLASTRTSFFHYSLGGYNAAKMRRYQEIWNWYLTQDLQQGKVQNNAILNMLNTKYIIFNGRDNSGPQYTINPQAFGNAWFVNTVQQVANPDSAIIALGRLQNKNVAIVEGKYTVNTNLNQPDSLASIVLTSYHPEHMVYKSVNENSAIALFSEMYYNDGWNAYIDGSKVDHFCANYVLRGLEIPKGEHTIEFKFEPATYTLGKTISNASSGAIFLLLIGSLVFGIRNQLKKA